MILTTEQVAQQLQVSTKFVLMQAATNRLRGFKVGRSWRFKQSDVSAWIEEAVA